MGVHFPQGLRETDFRRGNLVGYYLVNSPKLNNSPQADFHMHTTTYIDTVIKQSVTHQSLRTSKTHIIGIWSGSLTCSFSEPLCFGKRHQVESGRTLPWEFFLKLSIKWKKNNETVYLGFETVCDGFHKKTAFYTPLINGQEIYIFFSLQFEWGWLP